MTLKMFQYRILLTCAGAALGWYFAMGDNDLKSTSIFATVLAALAFGVGYIIDNVAAFQANIRRGPYALTQGYARGEEEPVNVQVAEWTDEDELEHPDEDLGSASLSLACHGYNPNRVNGQEH